MNIQFGRAESQGLSIKRLFGKFALFALVVKYKLGQQQSMGQCH
jgi:hypothetical protein